MAELTSANTVGYSTVQIKSQYRCIGVNFQTVNGESIPLNTMVPYQEGMTKGPTASSADQIQIGDTSGGWTIYFISNGKTAAGKDTIPSTDGLWCKEGTAKDAGVTIAPGQCFWYVRNDKEKPAFNLTIAGSVVSFESESMTFTSKYRIFTNPFTTPLPLNDAFKYDEASMTKGPTASSADQIQIADTEGGWSIYYLSNGKTAAGKDTIPSTDGLWCKEGTAKDAAVSIPLSGSAWYVRKDESKKPLTVTFTKPYDL